MARWTRTSLWAFGKLSSLNRGRASSKYSKSFAFYPWKFRRRNRSKARNKRSTLKARVVLILSLQNRKKLKNSRVRCRKRTMKTWGRWISSRKPILKSNSINKSKMNLFVEKKISGLPMLKNSKMVNVWFSSSNRKLIRSVTKMHLSNLTSFTEAWLVLQSPLDPTTRRVS